MDFQLDPDQQSLCSALQAILANHAEISLDHRKAYFWHDTALQAKLADAGFLFATRDVGAFEGVLVTLETAKLTAFVETGVSGLVAGQLLDDTELAYPAAITEVANLGSPIRNLPIANILLVLEAEDVVILPVAKNAVENVDSILGYPYGSFRLLPELGDARRLEGKAAVARHWWRLAMAAEIAGAARAAIDFTLHYVRQRQVLGRAVGSFQSVQHRLAWLHAWAEGTRYLTLRAGWSGTAIDSEHAYSHALQGIPRLAFDLHQFHGGMGVTNEYALHFWLYRIRALQGEGGGTGQSGLRIAKAMWE